MLQGPEAGAIRSTFLRLWFSGSSALSSAGECGAAEPRDAPAKFGFCIAREWSALREYQVVSSYATCALARSNCTADLALRRARMHDLWEVVCEFRCMRVAVIGEGAFVRIFDRLMKADALQGGETLVDGVA